MHIPRGGGAESGLNIPLNRAYVGSNGGSTPSAPQNRRSFPPARPTHYVTTPLGEKTPWSSPSSLRIRAAFPAHAFQRVLRSDRKNEGCHADSQALVHHRR